MLVGENVFSLAPPKHLKVAQKYLDLKTEQVMGDVQLHFHVHQTSLSQVLLCVLVHYHANTRHLHQGTMFEPLGSWYSRMVW